MKTIDLTDYQDKIYFTSDTHFNHFNICRYFGRPFKSRQEMNAALIANWNKVVPKDGIVIHCGDFMMNHSLKEEREYDKLANKLNGDIFLVRGNHDLISLREESYQGRNHIVWVGDILNIKIGDYKITASHYPLVCFPTNFNVFGHVHTLANGRIDGPDATFSEFLKQNRWRQYDVGVDQNNFRPISLYEMFDKVFGKEWQRK